MYNYIYIYIHIYIYICIYVLPTQTSSPSAGHMEAAGHADIHTVNGLNFVSICVYI